MQYRNLQRALLFNKAIGKYNRSSVMLFDMIHVQLLYSIHWITRNKPVAPTSDVRDALISIRKLKTSPITVLNLLKSMSSAGYISSETIGKRGYLLWSLTPAGHNTLKHIERLLRYERSDHRMSSTLVMPKTRRHVTSDIKFAN